jgi:hypothetical protein
VREADHSPPSSAEVKDEWSYSSTPPMRLHGIVLIKKKQRGNFTFIFMQWRGDWIFLTAVLKAEVEKISMNMAKI